MTNKYLDRFPNNADEDYVKNINFSGGKEHFTNITMLNTKIAPIYNL